MGLSDYQKNILELLLDKYERSKQYSEANEGNRAIMIKPTEVYKDYDSDFADIDVEHDFERDVLEMVERQMVTIRSKGKSILKIVLVVDSIQDIYELLKREPQKDIVQKQLALYRSWMGRNKLIDKYCGHQIDLLQLGKKAKYELDIAANLLRLLEFVCDNREMILERELSIAVFGDTKVFEKEYRAKLIYILKNYGEYEDILVEEEDEKEAIQAILEELNVYANPKYVYFKGNANIIFTDGTSYKLSEKLPIALPMDKFAQINSFVISDTKIMTVENLASYNRIHPEDCFCVYLAGYHNSAKQTLVKVINAQNPNKRWFHFGDIDPDGFMILENLKKKTGVEFKPIHMGIQELQKYGKYVKALQPNDITKAQTLIDKGLFVEEMQYMLCNNVKLEQEVISWLIGRGGMSEDEE